MSGDFINKPVVNIDAAGAPHVQVDENQQTLQYLADIALEDLRLLPDPSARRVRPGSLLAAYQADVAEKHAIEADGGKLDPAPEKLDIATSAMTGQWVAVPLVEEFKKED